MPNIKNKKKITKKSRRFSRIPFLENIGIEAYRFNVGMGISQKKSKELAKRAVVAAKEIFIDGGYPITSQNRKAFPEM